MTIRFKVSALSLVKHRSRVFTRRAGMASALLLAVVTGATPSVARAAPSPSPLGLHVARHDHAGADAVSSRHRARPCATRPAPPSNTVPTPPPVTAGSGVWSFVTEPRLHPMRVTVITRTPHTAPGDIFVAPYAAGRMVGQTGSLIVDNAGDPVWFRPLASAKLQNADFRVQTYHDPHTGKAQRVLTWWQGSIAIPPTYTNLPIGGAEPGGCYYIVDSHYRLIRTVFARHGFNPDEHEFTLTRAGTVLFVASKAVPMDLTPYGGPKDGAILDAEVQEVDLRTGRLVFSWDMLDHVDPADSETPASDATKSGGVWDAFHMNSIDERGGELLVSARNMWAVYKISKSSGRILWQLGGKRSDFTFGTNAEFFWQHDARFRAGNRISMFDDGCCNLTGGRPEQQSHGLILSLDLRRHRADAVRTYYHKRGLYSPSEGNMQALPNGNEFVGWGQNPYYSEYTGAGNSQGHGTVNLVYDARLAGFNFSYRILRNTWIGTPHYPPRAAARSSAGQRVVYASWNGSTQTRAWQVLAGRHADELSVVVRRYARVGFETGIPTNSRGPYFQVRALDGRGKVLGTSKVVKLRRADFLP